MLSDARVWIRLVLSGWLAFNLADAWSQPATTENSVLALSKIYPALNAPSWLQASVALFSGSDLARVQEAQRCFRSSHPGVTTAIGQMGGGDYALLAATHISQAESAEVMSMLSEGLSYEGVAACIGQVQSASPTKVEALKLQTRISGSTPMLQALPKPAEYDGIGQVRRRNDTEQRHAIVEGRYYNDPATVAGAIASFQGRYPDLHFVAIRHDGYYFVAVTSLVDTVGLDAARHAMRLRGAHELTALATFKPVKTTMATPDSTNLFDMEGRMLPKPPPYPITGEPLATEVLEYEDIFESRQQRISQCYIGYPLVSQPTAGGSGPTARAAVTVLSMANCAGVVVVEETLTRCLLESDCPGARVPILFNDISAAWIVRQCLAPIQGDGIRLPQRLACAATRLDPIYSALVERYDILSCLDSSPEGQKKCAGVIDLVGSLCETNDNQALCQQNPEVVAELYERTKALAACLSNGKQCEVLIQRRPADPSEPLRKELKRLWNLGQKIDPSADMKVIIAALGALGDASTVVQRFKECNELRGKDNAKAETCFMKIALSDTEAQAFDCVRQAGVDFSKRTECFAKPGSAEADALARAQCAAKSGGDPVRLAQCGGASMAEVDKIKEQYQCAVEAGSAVDASLNCIDGLPQDARIALECANLVGQSESDYLECLPGGNELAAARCLHNAKDRSQTLECVATQLLLPGVPPAMQQAMSCAAGGAEDMQSIAGCVVAANLPSEVRRAAACGAKSTGAVDFALCAVDLGLNPELRIAAECASSTGGEPISWAACSGGRLTVRELTKCLSGEIGKEGGCFGPNNDLVKTVNNIVKDLTQGFGPGNDLVKAVGEIGEACNKLGRDVSEGLKRLADDAKRGDIGKAICRIFRC